MELKPRHHSVLKRKTPQKPGLSVMNLPDETRTLIETECLDIFTRMSNSGMTLHQTLTAIFLSGMSAAQEAVK